MASQPEDTVGLTVLPPDEARRHSRPAPTDEEPAIEGLTDDEWQAFQRVLADR